MPERLIKPVIAFLSPSRPPSGLLLAWELVVSAFAAWATAGMNWIGGLHPSMQVFIWAMVADYLAGLYACGLGDGESGFWRSFSAEKGLTGIARKALIAVIFLLIWKIASLIGPSAYPVAISITSFGAINEGMSVVKNLRKGKYEVSPLADELLLRARRQFEASNEMAAKAGEPPKKENPPA